MAKRTTTRNKLYRVMPLADDSTFCTYEAKSDEQAHELIADDRDVRGFGFLVQRFIPGKHGGWVETWFCPDGID